MLVHNKFHNKLQCCYKFICVVATNVFVVDVNLHPSTYEGDDISGTNMHIRHSLTMSNYFIVLNNH